MRKFIVTETWTAYRTYEIEAENEEQAWETYDSFRPYEDWDDMIDANIEDVTDDDS